jgi:Na+/proline symporter
MEQLNWTVECVAFVIMIGLSVVVGLYYGCVQGKQNTVSEYLLGGRHMAVLPITMSLITRYCGRCFNRSTVNSARNE